ncbi:hypothetical protein BDC45DRAFT_561291 [Circinella umbellata]|nr:hypothetical protein BDC45DRAFT_561291 [Circinella umbellata]
MNSNHIDYWPSDHATLSYQSNGEGCFDLMPTGHEDTHDSIQCTASYNCLGGNSTATATSDTCMFAEGAPEVFCDTPITIGPTWPSYYAAGPQDSHIFYNQGSVSSSGPSMPPTPPDVVPNPASFSAGPFSSGPPVPSFKHQDPHYSNVSVNKDNALHNDTHLHNDSNTKSYGDTSFTSGITKHRKPRRSSDKQKERKKCSNCGSTKTPTWRRGPITKALLCNACGLYEKVSKKRRIVIVQTDGKTKISRGALNQLKYEQEQQGDMTRTCSQCHTIDAKRWYEQRNRNYYHPRNNSNNNNDNNNEKEKCLFICDRCIRSTTSKL